MSRGVLDPEWDSIAGLRGSSPDPPVVDRSAVVVGGAMAGLAATHALNEAGYDVTLYERQSYDEKRVNCGEAMTAAGMIPLEKTPENGFVNRTPAFEVHVFDDRDRRVTHGMFPAADCYITDRNIVERTWAMALADDGVTVHDGTGISPSRFRSFTEEFDLVVDATGAPSLSSRATGSTSEYGRRLVAVNADVTGDYPMYPRSIISFTTSTGYAWAFTKTERRANIGIGWVETATPDDYMEALEAACDRNGWPVPTRDQTNVYTIPMGPNLPPERVYDAERNVVRVGDAAGIANRVTGKGISQAVHSAYLMAQHAATDELEDYPRVLYRTFRGEYQLAYVMQHAIEAVDPRLLGSVVEALAGIEVEAIDRDPRTAVGRILRHPILVARLLRHPLVRRRLADAILERWDY